MFVIPERGKFSSKALVREYASLWEAPNRASHLEMDESVESVLLHVVLFLRPNGEKRQRHPHIFKIIQFCGEIKNFDVKAHIFCPVRTNHTVPMQLRCIEISRSHGPRTGWNRMLRGCRRRLSEYDWDPLFGDDSLRPGSRM